MTLITLILPGQVIPILIPSLFSVLISVISGKILEAR